MRRSRSAATASSCRRSNPSSAPAPACAPRRAGCRIWDPADPARSWWPISSPSLESCLIRSGFVPELPVNPSSGKLDRSALPDLTPGPEPHRDLVPPRSPAEHLVARAFSDHLRRGAPVSIHDDFFLDLGGNSLLAAETVSSLRKQGLTTSLTVRDVYEARTVAGLAARTARTAAGAAPQADRHREAPKTAAARPSALTPLAQLATIFAKLLLGSVAAWLAAFRLLPLIARDAGTITFLLLIPALALAAVVIYAPLALLATVAVKKLLIGRYREGRH